MAASTQSTLENIERRRAQLQESVEKLRKALTHWTTWEAEYQALKEELEDAEDASPAQIRDMAQSLGSSLLDIKEVEELLGKDLKSKRTANQVVNLLSRRIDYVQQNSATIEKQLDAAEKRLAGVDVFLDPGMDNEEGLPMMDIEEELDEEGNEVASSVNQTGKNTAELVEVLRKAGIQKAELDKMKAGAGIGNGARQDAQPAAPPAAPVQKPVTNTPPEADPVTGNKDNSKPPKKTVSFANDSQSEPPRNLTSLEKLQKYGYNDDLADMNFTHGTKVIELDENDNEIASYPIIPQGESPEDAELRRQMLQYGLSEVGQIVAELDLDHPTAEFPEDEDDDEDDADYGNDTEDDEEEDQYGRSTKPVITHDYRKQMRELEKKLNARMMENVGPEANDDPLAEHAEDVRTLRVRPDDQFDEQLGSAEAGPGTTGSDKKKGVRFADELDVSDPPQLARQSPTTPQPSTKPAPTISNTIVERSATQWSATAAPSKPAMVSRFKSSRAEAGQPPRMLPTPVVPEALAMPTGPTGRTLATTVVEHNPSATEPNAPDEFDPLVLNREIQADYHKARNKYIQQQGGFKPTQEDLESPLLEEKDGKTKKVSRFMASRLNASGM
jgi:unconventional prefoldin RPB5 interactor 1